MIENVTLAIIALGLFFIPIMAIKVALDDKKSSESPKDKQKS
ncbi:hypothetical protein OQH61_03185 [Helicobacter sp. MIT 21-1697]|nr:hypothetical protein [Helicobacter sp. MIT 21-1697]MCX2716736.1 hypothetical protein [Helicobacter sp. MIT 21-1697]